MTIFFFFVKSCPKRLKQFLYIPTLFITLITSTKYFISSCFFFSPEAVCHDAAQAFNLRPTRLRLQSSEIADMCCQSWLRNF